VPRPNGSDPEKDHYDPEEDLKWIGPTRGFHGGFPSHPIFRCSARAGSAITASASRGSSPVTCVTFDQRKLQLLSQLRCDRVTRFSRLPVLLPAVESLQYRGQKRGRKIASLTRRSLSICQAAGRGFVANLDFQQSGAGEAPMARVAWHDRSRLRMSGPPSPARCSRRTTSRCRRSVCRRRAPRSESAKARRTSPARAAIAASPWPSAAQSVEHDPVGAKELEVPSETRNHFLL
jgi:hypothetical protein